MLGKNKALIFFNDIQSSSAWPPVPQNYPSFNGGPWECACTTLLIVSGYFVMCHTAHLTKSFFLKYRYILHNCSIQCIALESTLVSVLEGSSPYRIAGFIRQTTRIQPHSFGDFCVLIEKNSLCLADVRSILHLLLQYLLLLEYVCVQYLKENIDKIVVFSFV